MLIAGQDPDEQVSLYCGESISQLNNIQSNVTIITTPAPDAGNETMGQLPSTWETPHLLPDLSMYIKLV